jgi:hypothetical protein
MARLGDYPGVPEFTAELVADYVSKQAVVHVSYRYGSGRHWTRFYLVPDAGESFESVAAKIVPAIELHHEVA